MARAKTVFYKQGHFWGAFGAFLTLFCAGLEFGHRILAHCFFGASLLFAIATLLIVTGYFRVRKQWEIVAAVAVTMAIFAVDVRATGGWLRHSPTPLPSPPVANIFLSTYAKHKTRLGNPTATVESDKAYQARHHRAIVVWLWARRAFYRLPDSEPKKWTRVDDVEQTPDRIYTDVDLRPLFRKWHITQFDQPPYGGVAHYWLKDPDNWKWIGWREWDCYLEPGQIMSQTFEHGTIAGPFTLNKINKNFQLLIFFDDGTWMPDETKRESMCSSPPFSERD